MRYNCLCVLLVAMFSYFVSAHAQQGQKGIYSFGQDQTIADIAKMEWAPLTLQGLPPGIEIAVLLLLRHRIGVALAVLRGALQQGHRARVVARATIRCRRIVAIGLATCRSGRMGGASGRAILGDGRRRELIGGSAGG